MLNKLIKQLASSKRQWNIVTLFLIGLSIPTAMAQSPWHASIGVESSLTKFRTNFDSPIENDHGNSGAINLGIGYTLSDNWSVHSGVGLGYLGNDVRLSNYSDKQNAIDIEGETFEFRYTLSGYSENQDYTVVSIPVAFQYETAGNTRFYGRAGASYNIFVTSETEAMASNMTTTGFFPEINAELEAPEFAGFGTFEDIAFTKQDISIKNALTATLELGIKQSIADKHWLYLGFFVETSLNNLIDSNNGSLIEYNRENPSDFRVTPVFNATDQNSGNTILKEVKFKNYGLRLWYSFNF